MYQISGLLLKNCDRELPDIGTYIGYAGYPTFWESRVTGKVGYRYYPRVYPYQSLLWEVIIRDVVRSTSNEKLGDSSRGRLLGRGRGERVGCSLSVLTPHSLANQRASLSHSTHAGFSIAHYIIQQRKPTKSTGPV